MKLLLGEGHNFLTCVFIFQYFILKGVTRHFVTMENDSQTRSLAIHQCVPKHSLASQQLKHLEEDENSG